MAVDTVVLVHGAFHGSWCWDEVVGPLRSYGLHVVTADIPGPGRGSDVPLDLTAQGEYLRGLITAQAGPVLVCGHSLGGLLISEALTADLPVSRLVYLASFTPEIGQSATEAVMGTPDTAVAETIVDGDVLTVSEAYANDAFYSDLIPEQARSAYERLVPEPLSVLAAPATHAAWREIPSSFVVCAKDRAISPVRQREWARGVEVSYELDCGHSPMINRAEDVAAILRAETLRSPR